MNIKNSTACIILFVLAVISFAPPLANGFMTNWDDGINITDNRPLQSPHAIAAIWQQPAMPSYLPVAYTFFWCQFKLWGLNPFFFHSVNIALHALITLLVFFVLKRFSNSIVALTTTALWCTHPLRTEAVAWITEQKTLLSTLFALTALLAFFKTLDGKRPYTPFIILLFIMGMLSKINIITLPFVMLAIAYAQKKRIRYSWALSSFLLIIGAGILFIAKNAENSNLEIVHQMNIPLHLHIFIAARSMVFYIFKTLIPAGLIPVYPRWEHTGLDYMYIAHGLLFVVLCIAVITASFRYQKIKHPAFYWWCYILTILPISGITPIPYMDNTFVADRYSYFPSIFLTAFFVGIAAVLTSKKPLTTRFQKEACVALTVLYATLSWHQTKIWNNIHILWEHTLTLNPTCESAHTNLGTYYSDNNFLDTAFYHYRMAYRLNPHRELTNYNMGMIYARLDKLHESEKFYREILRIEPSHPEASCNLGNNLIRQGRLHEAQYYLDNALRNPKHSPLVARTVQINYILLKKAENQ